MNSIIEKTKRIQLNQYTCLPPKSQRIEDDNYYHNGNSKPKSKKKNMKKEKQPSTIATEKLLSEKFVSAGLPQQPPTVCFQQMAKQQQESPDLFEKQRQAFKKMTRSTKIRPSTPPPEEVRCKNVNVNGSIIPPDFVFYSDDEPDKTSENLEDLTKHCDSRLKDLLMSHEENPNTDIKINEKLLKSETIAGRKKELFDLTHALRIFDNIRARKRENEKLQASVSLDDDRKSAKLSPTETSAKLSSTETSSKLSSAETRGILKSAAEESPKSPKTVTFHSSVKTEEKPKIRKSHVSKNGCLSHDNCGELEYVDRIFELDTKNYKFDDEIRHVPTLAPENFTFIKRFEYVDPYTAQIYNHYIPPEYFYLGESMFINRTVPYSSLNLYSNAPSVASQNDNFDQAH